MMGLALITCMISHATSETLYGTWTVTSYGNTLSSDEGGVVIVSNEGELDNVTGIIPPFGVGNMLFSSVPSATVNGITVYSAVREEYIAGQRSNAFLLARYYEGMMIVDISIPSRNITMRFDNVYDHFQLPNSDMEAWTNANSEPDRWHGFKTATGAFASLSPALLEKSEDVHNGSNGQYSAVVTAKSAGFSIANGTMTNGQLNAASWTATSTSNHASMDQSYGDDFYMPLYAKPDQFKVWLQYKQGTTNANNKASVSVKTFDGTYYQEPADKTYTNLSGSIVGGQVDACDWTEFTFPIDYDSYADNNAATQAIFVTFSTNANPGQGSSNDQLFIDDMALIYLASMTDLRYQGTTITGWDPAVTEYNMEFASAPSLDDFAATVTGASAVVTKSMEQNEDGSYRIAISAVSGDLQTATAYIINATVAAATSLGDVDEDGEVNIGDVTTLINYLLTGNDGINLVNADVDGDKEITINDVTTLINYLLTGTFTMN